MAADVLLELNKSKWTGRLLGITLAIALLATFLVQTPELWDRYRVVKDVQNLYRMARYQDPSLFANDPSGGFGAVDLVILGRPTVIYPRSLGYGLLLLLGSFFIDYLWIIKGLTFILMPLSVVYLFKFGQHLKDNLTGLSLSLFFVFFILASYQSISISSGLQRAFAVPLVIIFLYYLIKQQYLTAGLTLVVNALIYLPDFPILALTYVLVLFNIDFPFKRPQLPDRSKLASLIISLALSALVIGFALAVEFKVINLDSQNKPQFVDQPPYLLTSQALLDHSQGFAEMFFAFPFLGRAGILDAGTDVMNLIVLSICGIFIYLVLGRESIYRLPKVCKQLLVASLVMYTLSMFAIFGLSSLALYFPSRYTRVTLFVLALFYVALNWPEFLRKLSPWMRRKAPLLIFFVVSLLVSLGGVYIWFPTRIPLTPLLWFFGMIAGGLISIAGTSYMFLIIVGKISFGNRTRWAVFLVTTIITLYVGTIYIKTLGLRTINPSSAERAVYEFIATLPKDVILAGDPDFMMGVPLFSERSVVFSALHPDVNAPILDFFDTLYAESPETVLNFCQRFGVSYLVIETSDFSPTYLTKQEFFFQPFNKVIVEMVAGRTDFVLPHLQPVFTSGPLEVIKCDTETVLAAKN